jgi:hypothetical protein
MTAAECIWRESVIAEHRGAIRDAMLSEIGCYAASDTFARVAWQLHLMLDCDLEEAGELLLPTAREIYRRVSGE